MIFKKLYDKLLARKEVSRLIVEFVILGSVLTIAVYYDITVGKIPNKLLIISLLGLIINIITNNKVKNAPFDYILGLIFPFISLFILFRIRVLGSGDIKLLSLMGAFIGIGRILQVFMYTAISAVIYGIILMIVQKSIYSRFKSLFRYAVSFLKTGNLENYQTYIAYKNSQLCFSLCIAIGYIVETVNFYFL